MSAQPIDELGTGAPNRYFDKSLGCEAVKLVPGEYFATDAGLVLVTVLGSCVSACLRDPVTGIGGMNHFMLPRDGSHHPVSRSARYGAFAMEVLINQMLRLGARRERLEAKVFGGAAVIHGLEALSIGDANAAFVIEYLAKERIKVVAEDLQGTEPRKVYFYPRTGRALVRVIRRMHNATIVQRELDYTRRLNQLPSGGDIELFK